MAMSDHNAPCAQRARGLPRTPYENTLFPDRHLPTRDRVAHMNHQNTGDQTCEHQAPAPRNQLRACGGGVWSAMSTRHAARAAAPQLARIHRTPTGSKQSKIDRVRNARAQIARKITDGEEWMLPLLKRFNTELARLEGKRPASLLCRA